MLNPFDGLKDGLKLLLNQIGSGAGGNVTDLLTKTPAGQYPQAYRTVTAIATTAVKPVAMTVLAVVFSLEVLKASRHVEDDGTRGVRTIVSSLFKIILIYLAATNAAWLCQLITYLIQQMGTGVSKLATAVAPSGGAGIPNLGDRMLQAGKIDDSNTFQQLLAAILLIIPFIISKLAEVAVNLLVMLRFVELLILTSFGALPIAFLSFDGTKSWGEGYIREYASCAFSNVTLLIGLGVYKAVADDLFKVDDLTHLTLNQLVFQHWQALVEMSVLMIGLVLISQKASKALFGQV